MSVPISTAVEGLVDEAVARKVLAHVGAVPGVIYGTKGKSHLRSKIDGYNRAARHAPWLVLVDLDQDAACASALRNEWVREVAPLLCFRIVVREIEAWLMADATSLAAFLRVSVSRVPSDPESIVRPKDALVQLARQSKRIALRRDMVPRPGSGRAVGPAYTSRLIEYVDDQWRPEIAARSAESLRRALACLRRLV